MMFQMLAPIKVIESDAYALIIKDALGITHYWSEDGHYDGYSIEINNEEYEN